MRSCGTEAERLSLPLPRERDTTTVTTDIGLAGAQIGRILTLVTRNLNDLVQTQFLALIDVRRTRQPQDEHRRRASTAEATLAI